MKRSTASMKHYCIITCLILASPIFTNRVRADACDTPIFPAPDQYATGDGPISVAVGDFNGDGRDDLAVTDFNPAKVSVLLRNADGTFQPKVGYDSASSPFAIAVGDLNKDGTNDLAVANWGLTLSVLINKGDGTFWPMVDYPAGNASRSVAMGDFNGDGTNDLVTANSGSADISVFINKGDGTFYDAVNYGPATGLSPAFVAVGYFNGDNNLDLAVANVGFGTVSVLPGNGDGTFCIEDPFPFCVCPDSCGTSLCIGVFCAGGGPQSIAVGDFNSDSRADLAVSSGGFGGNPGSVVVLLASGTGTFTRAVAYGAPGPSEAVAIGDFNADGSPDLVVGNDFSATFSVLLNRGDGTGTFQAAVDYVTASPGASLRPYSVAVGKFNADLKPDLAVLNSGLATISVVLNNGDGTFAAAVAYRTGGLGLPVAVAVSEPGQDFNGDGNPDLAAAAGDVAVLLGNADGTFQSAVKYAVGWAPHSVAVGNFNGDNFGDLVAANSTASDVSVLLSNGDGTFQAINSEAGGGFASVAVGDLNNDGKDDLALANQSVSVLLGNGNGTFQPKVDFEVDGGATSVAVDDFNGDSKPDLAVTRGALGISVLLNSGDINLFAPKVDYAAGNSFAIAVGKFNGDIYPDLAVANPVTVSVLLGNADGTFQTAISYPTGNGTRSVAVGDFNGDGKRDLAVANLSSPSVSVLLGNGDGTFGAPVSYDAPSPYSVAVSDFNHDNKPDLAVATALDLGSIQVLLNNCTANTITPVITWANAADIVYGTPLTGAQLNATANVPGSFAYTPGLRTVLHAGSGQILSVTFTPTDTAHYDSANASVSINVLKANLTVTPRNKNKVYGAVVPAFTATYQGFVNPDTAAVLDTLNLSTTATAGSSVGTYPITASGSDNDYNIIPGVPATLTVTPKPLTIKAQNKNKVYGAALPTLTATYAGLVEGDSLDTPALLSTTALAQSDVGTYPITVSGATDSNYVITLVDGTLTVTKKLLTIKAQNKNKVYGAALPDLTATYAGLVNGDTVASLDTAAVLSTTALAESNSGTYPIMVSGATDANYTINFVDGTLTVTKALLTIKADSQSKVYGAALPILTATYLGFVNGDDQNDLLTPVTLTTTATAASNVGSYPIVPSAATADNYTVKFVNGSVAVTRAPLTIAAENKTKAQGTVNPPLTATYSGFVNNDAPVNLDTPVTLTTTAKTTSPVGTYPITAKNARDANYTITFVNGTMDVFTVTHITTCPFVITSPGHYQLDADLSGCSPYTIAIQANDVDLNLNGHTISGPVATDGDCSVPGDSAGIVVNGSNAHIYNGTVQGFKLGISLIHNGALVNNNHLKGLTVVGNCHGMVLRNSHNNLINANNISGNFTQGVILQSSTGNTFDSNTVNDNHITGGGGGGLYFAASDGNFVTSNDISGNAGVGIRLDNDGNGPSDGNTIQNNTFNGLTRAQGLGIWITAGSNNQILSNTVDQNDTGIAISSSPNTGNVIQNNTIRNCIRDGISIGLSVSGNTIQGNTALGNASGPFGDFDLRDANAPNCINTWSSNIFVTDNEVGLDFGPNAGCIQ